MASPRMQAIRQETRRCTGTEKEAELGAAQGAVRGPGSRLQALVSELPDRTQGQGTGGFQDGAARVASRGSETERAAVSGGRRMSEKPVISKPQDQHYLRAFSRTTEKATETAKLATYGPVDVRAHPYRGSRTPTDVMRARRNREATKKAEQDARKRAEEQLQVQQGEYIPEIVEGSPAQSRSRTKRPAGDQEPEVLTDDGIRVIREKGSTRVHWSLGVLGVEEELQEPQGTSGGSALTLSGRRPEKILPPLPSRQSPSRASTLEQSQARPVATTIHQDGSMVGSPDAEEVAVNAQRNGRVSIAELDDVDELVLQWTQLSPRDLLHMKCRALVI
jgi:hypothetical protein